MLYLKSWPSQPNSAIAGAWSPDLVRGSSWCAQVPDVLAGHTSPVAATTEAVVIATRVATITTSRGQCRCGQSWADPRVQHFCELVDAANDGDDQAGGQAHDASAAAPRSSLPTRRPTTECAVARMTTTGSAAASSPSHDPIAGQAALQEQGCKDLDADNSATESIQVFVRIRPLVERERVALAASSSSSTSLGLRAIDAKTVEVQTADATVRCAYDGVLDATITQEQVYDRVRDCVQSFLQGFNATLFAYGQTGSGKSFTMFGDEQDDSRFRPGLHKSQAGVLPRAIMDVFAGIVQHATARVYCSFVQIYNEQLFDLLRDGPRETPLTIHEDREHGLYVDGLSEYAVRNVQDCLTLLQCGEQHRAVRATSRNHVSSRSHSVFQLALEQPQPDGAVLKSKLNLVDLAGSEKWQADEEMAAAHLAEMTTINLSLHTLGRCVAALSSASASTSAQSHHHHVPYRDSKLTRLLQDSLGGNTKTRIIATLSPSFDCVEESLSTLKFADRAKQVMVTVHVNEKRVVDMAYVDRLEKEVKHLRRLLQLVPGAAAAPSVQVDPKCEHGASSEEDRADGNTTTTDNQQSVATLIKDNLTLRTQVETLQQQVEQMRSACATAGAIVRTPSSASPPQRTDSALQELQATLDRFFKFEIEEEELRTSSNRIFQQQGVTSMAVRSGHASAPPGSVRSSGEWLKPHPPRGKTSDTPALAPDILYRVRSRASSLPSQGEDGPSSQWKSTASAKASADDPERALEASRKALEKQKKLQDWLLEKEQRELLKLQQQQEYIEAERRAIAERDAKFLKHAQATKRKLQAAQQSAAQDATGNNNSAADS